MMSFPQPRRRPPGFVHEIDDAGARTLPDSWFAEGDADLGDLEPAPEGRGLAETIGGAAGLAAVAGLLLLGFLVPVLIVVLSGD